ncbi:MAG: sulfite exporter TauE/SafE family protein [Aquabacterium commune]|uniref:sulfite exporter TauE/SafE family protein n=1 Tax=Aquabacterium commune TaxID=70586 RepID=UPI003BB03A93
MTAGILLGFGVGIVLGLTGAGGGILAVPALVLGMGWTLQAATPVALLAVGMSASLGALDGLRKGLVRWRAGLLVAGLGLLCAPVGVNAAKHLPQPALLTMFATLMLFIAYRLLKQYRESRTSVEPTQPDGVFEKSCMLNPGTGRLTWTKRCAATLSCVGSLSGLLTGMLGVGGGFFIVPAFKQWTDLRVHGIVATSLFVIAMVSLGATTSALLTGPSMSHVGMMFVCSAMGGMVAGRLVSPRLPASVLQTGFALLAIGVAVVLLLHTWIA